MHEIIGWLSSAILVPTLVRQNYTQWKSGTSRGVSFWLYGGSFFSSAGFVFYSYHLGNWVFLVTNLCLVLNNIVGVLLILYQRRIISYSESGRKL